MINFFNPGKLIINKEGQGIKTLSQTHIHKQTTARKISLCHD